MSLLFTMPVLKRKRDRDRIAALGVRSKPLACTWNTVVPREMHDATWNSFMPGMDFSACVHTCNHEWVRQPWWQNHAAACTHAITSGSDSRGGRITLHSVPIEAPVHPLYLLRGAG